MDQQRIGTGLMIGFGAFERLDHTPAGDQRLDPGHQTEIVVDLAVFASLDLAAELVDIGQRLTVADEGVGLGEQLVFDTDTGDAPLAQLADHAADIVEITVTGIAVDQNGDGRRIRHEFENFQHLRPGRLVAVANTERGGNRQTGCPNAVEAGFLDDFRRQPVMRFHHKLGLR